MSLDELRFHLFLMTFQLYWAKKKDKKKPVYIMVFCIYTLVCVVKPQGLFKLVLYIFFMLFKIVQNNIIIT